MTRVLSALAVAAVLVALAPQAAAQTFAFAKVEFEFDKDLDFTQLRTYGWAPLYSPAKDPANHVNVKWHVERGLEKKGLRRAPEAETLLRRVLACGRRGKADSRPGRHVPEPEGGKSLQPWSRLPCEPGGSSLFHLF